MKAAKSTLFFFVALCAFLFSGCVKDECAEVMVYKKYSPVYLTAEEIANSVKIEASHDLKDPGRIYYYHPYLLINEREEGIHIIDNSDPENPVSKSFIRIPGNQNMAVKNGILYADNYNDLVAIDISDLNAPEVMARTTGVFNRFYFQESTGFLVDYIEEDETIEIECNDVRWGRPWFKGGGGIYLGIDVVFDNTVFNETSGATTGNQPGAGIGGSMARFTITGDHLYVLQDSELDVFRLQADGSPQRGANVQLGWGMETIFPYKSYLFLGARNGMYIYDNSNPDLPVFLSQYAHIVSCDPVFVSNDIAFVTLNGNGPCNSFSNQLEVIDLQNITSPSLIKTYPMEDPLGLSVRNQNLYLCDGRAGLKVFDVEDLQNISSNQIAHLDDIHAYDVIALPANDILLLVGENGFYQYEAKEDAEPRLLSFIRVKK